MYSHMKLKAILNRPRIIRGYTERYAMIFILLFNWAEVHQSIEITSFKSHAI